MFGFRSLTDRIPVFPALNIRFTRLAVYLLGSLIFLFVVLLSWHHHPAVTGRPLFSSPTDDSGVERNRAVHNRTLGFQQIIAITTGTPWRVQGLKAAADSSGIDVTFYNATQVPETMVQRLQSDANLGSARAWAAHLSVLNLLVTDGVTSALIVEDDVDWDINIKRQLGSVASAIASMSTPALPRTLFSIVTGPYGVDWDVLWLGHCGEDFTEAERKKLKQDSRFAFWNDPTVVDWEDYTGNGVGFTRSLPPGSRAAITTNRPVCTFAYAVTLRGAQKLSDHAYGQAQAFDVKLGNMCNASRKTAMIPHADHLTCFTVVPELFNQYEAKLPKGYVVSDIGPVNHANEAAYDGGEVEVGHTQNIKYSARCDALWGRQCLH